MSLPGRTTQLAVQNICDCDPSIDLSPFIDTANDLVTEFCVIPAGLPANVANQKWNQPYMPALGDDRLELIERWLSAHFYAMRDPQFVQQSIGGASMSTGMQMGKGLELTRYGQMAMLLDTSGGLAGLNARITQGNRKRQIGVKHMGRSSCRVGNYINDGGEPGRGPVT